ncbi:hypothetical protein [Falsigemmobacter faecalis]|uniref:Translocase n=1 Tax=Falsigemmobacter faecalis TaxID=2488730 RepID=A0A3P3DRX4_9RHOB|nr:hypothetical protein [Falsigemmobacter faecalis]RRH76694.1 hypothetical protein EG244_05880 [Falsigemmobacter faecalis]
MTKQQMIRVGAIVTVTAVSFVALQMAGDKGGPAAPVQMAAAAVPAADPAPAAAARVEPARAEPAAPAAVVTSAPVIIEQTADSSLDAPLADSPVIADCREDMALIPQAGAMLDLGLLAPCRPNERVVIRHGGLVITGQTSQAGTLIASVPAFTAPAEVRMDFADGTSISQSVEIEGLDDFDRFAVQWMEGDAFSLHALTPGADYDSVWHLSAINPGRGSEEGHFISVLGDPSAERPLMAEVYTWPKGQAAADSAIAFSLEAAVTPQSCGREMPAETLQFSGGKLLVRELSISMPDCTATGEFLVLPNPVSPEKLAAN